MLPEASRLKAGQIGLAFPWQILNSFLLFYKFIVLIINVLINVIKFIIKQLNLGVFVLNLNKYI
jgi:hypothetical protein